MQKGLVVRVSAVAVVLAAFAAAVTAWSGRAVALPYSDVVNACDSENARKPGSCEKIQADIGVLHGCAGSGACFVCPTDGRRRCYPATDSSAGGVIHGKNDVTLSADGVDVKDLTDACDSNANGGGNCNYTVDTLTVVNGRSTDSGTQFQCIDGKECHRLN